MRTPLRAVDAPFAADADAPPIGHGFIALMEAFRGTGGTAPGEILGALQRVPQRVRLVLPKPRSGWALACRFAAPNTWLDEARRVDSLEPDSDAVLRAAQSLKWIDVLAPPWVPRTPGIGPCV